MTKKGIFIFIISFATACFALYHIYMYFILSLQAQETLSLAFLAVSSFLILNVKFWFWIILAWISAYILIKTYLVHLKI